MAYDEAIRNITLTADASLAGYTGVAGTPGSASPAWGKGQYRFVKITGAKQCGRAIATPLAIGVCQSKPQVVGEAATVAIRGISVVLTGNAFNPGDEVGIDSTGRAIGGVTAGTGCAIAVEASTGADQLSSVLLRTS